MRFQLAGVAAENGLLQFGEILDARPQRMLDIVSLALSEALLSMVRDDEED